MRSEDSRDGLLGEGLIKKCTVDFQSVGNLLSRASTRPWRARRLADP